VARTVYGERLTVKRKEDLMLADPAPSRRDVVKIARYEVPGLSQPRSRDSGKPGSLSDLKAELNDSLLI
jgi:hypothetical protein